MPRVVPDQREKFENDELFRKLRRESEIRYTGYQDSAVEERRIKLIQQCEEGHANVVFVCLGINLQLLFISNAWSNRDSDRVVTAEFVDFHKEPGKVHLKSQFLLNGVCVIWRGWLDLHSLDGSAHLEFDADRAQVEDEILQEQIEQYSQYYCNNPRSNEEQLLDQQLRNYRSAQEMIHRTNVDEADAVQALLKIATSST